GFYRKPGAGISRCKLLLNVKLLHKIQVGFFAYLDINASERKTGVGNPHKAAESQILLALGFEFNFIAVSVTQKGAVSKVIAVKSQSAVGYGRNKILFEDIE